MIFRFFSKIFSLSSIMGHLQLFFSTKTTRAIYVKLKSSLFCTWCFHCETRLKDKENGVCRACLPFLFNQTENVLAPDGSILKQLLMQKKPFEKQNELIEAIFLQALLPYMKNSVVVLTTDETIFNHLPILKKLVHPKNLPLENRLVILLGIYPSEVFDLLKQKVLLSCGHIFHSFFLFENNSTTD